jgi:glutathione S-transferase
MTLTVTFSDEIDGVKLVRYAPEKIPYGIKRYQDETRRLYTVYEDHLANGNREFLVGSGVGKYSLADICTFPWIRIHDWSGISLTADEYPHLHAWLERIVARPAVKLGLDIPHKDPMEETKDPATAEERAKEASRWIMEGVKREQEALAAKAAAKAKKA